LELSDINATVYNLTAQSGSFSCLGSNYTNNLYDEWNINTGTSKKLTFTFFIDTEAYCDFVTIYEVDSLGIENDILYRSGFSTGCITTTISSGRAKIVFDTDYSNCGADPNMFYTGFSCSYALEDAFTVNQNLYVDGNTVLNGNVNVNIINGTSLSIGSKYKIKFSDFPGHTVWMDMPIKVGKASGIGSGGAGVNAWIAYAGSATQWFTNSSAGDICYRNTTGKLLFGNSLGDAAMAVSGNNVGIGTTTPGENNKLEVVGKLRVNGEIYGSTILSFQDDTRFSVTDSTVSDLNISPFSMPHYGIAAPSTGGSADLWIAGNNGIRMFTAGNKSPRLSITNAGKVLIGTTLPDPTNALLTVNGTIHAKEINVTVDIPADYVFQPAYKLMPLSQVEQFVKTNFHLPEIPSAAEITKNGLSVGEMQNKLLQKIEELTLYVIEQEKRIKQLEKNHK